MNINIDELTIGQAKELASLFQAENNNQSLNCMIGEKVIIRTYSAGVWFGELEQKARDEVILKNARRMFSWQAKESITLSAVAVYGVNHDKSKIVEAVSLVWLQAIEIIPCTEQAIISLEGAPNVEAE